MNAKLFVGALVIAVAAFGVAASSTQQANAVTDEKVTICHRNNAVNNRYTRNSVSVNAIDGEGQNDHSHHEGPVAYNEARAIELKNGDPSTDEDKTKWGDIIPPFRNDGTPTGYPAYNWDVIGQAVWYSGCDEPNAATAAVSTTPATCEAGETLVYGAIANATFSGTPNGTTGPVNYAVTATADQDALFYNVTPPTNVQLFNGTLADKLPQQSTDPEAPCYKAPETPETPETPQTPNTPPTTASAPVAPRAQAPAQVEALPYTGGQTAPIVIAGAGLIAGATFAIARALRMRSLNEL